jgi:hypothetical protein
MWQVVEEELRVLASLMSTIGAAGDEVWRRRDYGNLNIVLLSIYVHTITGRWHDEKLSLLLRTALEIEKKPWRSTEDSATAIAQVRRRFGIPQAHLERMWESARSDARLEKKRHREFEKRYLFRYFETLVKDFVFAVENSRGQRRDASLLEFLNECFLLELDSLPPREVE